MVIQASYSSVSPAIDDWYKTVNDSNASKANIQNAEQQITALQNQISGWLTQINQDLADEEKLLLIIRGFAGGQTLTSLNNQLTSWINTNPTLV